LKVSYLKLRQNPTQELPNEPEHEANLQDIDPTVQDAISKNLGSATSILDQVAAQRLMNNKGVTIQWISWDHRGKAAVSVKNDRWYLKASQRARPKDGTPNGELNLEGQVIEIGKD
jgi:hypothetical protein